MTGTPVAGQSVVILTGGEVTGGSEADRAAAVAYLANQLATDGHRGGRRRPDRLRGRDRHGRRHPRRHGAQRDRHHGRQRGHRRPAGIAAVLGLVEQNGGGVGRYGFADNAQAQVPTLAVG